MGPVGVHIPGAARACQPAAIEAAVIAKISVLRTAIRCCIFDLLRTKRRPQLIGAGTDPAARESAAFILTRASPAAQLCSGSILEYALPTRGSEPAGISAGPDGALWFTEEAGNRIGRITTSGSISEYAVPTRGSEPVGITAGPDGAIW